MSEIAHKKRVHNFSAGPAALPLPVLERAAAELVDFRGAGRSLMELSHRGPIFGSVIDEARERIARLYALPDDFEVLFLQGGASLQFAMVPMNLGPHGAYLNSGTWATRALAEARELGEAYELWSGESGGFSALPDGPTPCTSQARYLHFTSNNTIYGTQYAVPPTCGRKCPLVADLSSDFLSRPIDWNPFALAYAGAQKNAGPSGVTVVIGRRELLRAPPALRSPKILRYQTHAEKGSMYNTPNTYGIYLLGLVAEWVEEQGGLVAVDRENQQKAELLYNVIDGHPECYLGHAVPASRSLMNVTFRLQDPAREAELLAAAEAAELYGLKGHRSVGGLRASIYNAVPRASVERLAELLDDFAARG